MTTSPTLLSLADRVEKLTGPCDYTDAEIALALNPNDDAAKTRIGYGFYTRSQEPCPRYTASLDAAMTLVPPNHSCRIDWGDVSLDGSDIPPSALVKAYGLDYHVGDDIEAATPALALVAASLRALSSPGAPKP